ncbi:MAG TPA: hypothetical protein VG848_13160 [Acetobacteraceae bacterium]|nr:hypothetical protein [Acetobacteraceae bacterium]
MTPLSWPIFLALIAGFGCDTIALYRLRSDNGPLARVLIAISLLTAGVLLVYTFAINPYPQKPAITTGFLGAAIFLFGSGVAFLALVPSGAKQSLAPETVCALLPESITGLTPAQMRSLVPACLGRQADQELRAMVLMYLGRSSPKALRSLTPERLRALLRREIPRSILNS